MSWNESRSLSLRLPINFADEQGGFTLVELLVTIVVAAILVGSLSTIANNNVLLGERGRDLMVANSFAENKVEELRSKGYLTLANGTTDITSQMPADLKSPRSASIQINDASAGLKTVIVSITYNEAGQQKTYNYKTFLGELGVAQY